jgi:hypothetical protein
MNYQTIKYIPALRHPLCLIDFRSKQTLSMIFLLYFVTHYILIKFTFLINKMYLKNCTPYKTSLDHLTLSHLFPKAIHGSNIKKLRQSLLHNVLFSNTCSVAYNTFKISLKHVCYWLSSLLSHHLSSILAYFSGCLSKDIFSVSFRALQ